MFAFFRELNSLKCAGPYGQYLLGISDELAAQYIQFLYMRDENSKRIGDWTTKNYEIFKPGFTRINLIFFLEQDQIELILNAIKFISEHGWKLLPFYEFNIVTGEFKHTNSKV